MRKIKSIFKSIGVFFLCTICVCLSACSGGWNFDDIGDDDDISDYQSGFSMDNVKVLRRSYGDNKATITAVSQAYYDEFAMNVIKYLDFVYGGRFNDQPYSSNIFEIIINGNDSELEDLKRDLGNNADYFKYFYDAMRYQVSGVNVYYQPKWVREYTEDGTTKHEYSNAETQPEGFVKNKDKVFTKSDLPADVSVDETPICYEVSVDETKGWNWGLNTTLTDGTTKYANAFITYFNDKNPNANSINLDKSYFLPQDFIYDNTKNDYGFYAYYSKPGECEYFLTNTLMPFDTSFYTSLLYDETNYKTTGGTDFQKALTYVIYCIVNNREPNQIVVTKSNTGNSFFVQGYPSLDVALATEKNFYTDNASYVGFTKGDQEKIAEYILKKIIGENAISFSKNDSMQNLFYEELIPILVSYCTTLTTIGQTEIEGETKDDPTLIAGQYLSSDIYDYEYNSSYVNGDCYNDDDEERDPFAEFAHLGQYEYQSMLLMPTESGKIDEIWLDFAYYGDGGTNDSITIRTYIRNYTGGGNVDVYKKDITVQEGTLDVGEDGTTLCFDFSKLSSVGYLQADKIDFDKAINSAYYQARVAGLRPNGLSREITIQNIAEARNYYSLVEGEYRDYGVFDWKKLEGTQFYNSCYVEIAFEVISATTNNYRFYCGCSQVSEYTAPDYSKFQ